MMVVIARGKIACVMADIPLGMPEMSSCALWGVEGSVQGRWIFAGVFFRGKYRMGSVLRGGDA